MNFKVMSKKDAIAYCEEVHIDKSVIISMSNTDAEKPHFNFVNRNNKVMAVLYLQVDDIQKSYNGYKYFFGKNNNGIMSEEEFKSCGLHIFNEKDAELVYNFVTRNEDKVNTIIVHCAAGISRSSGCCAAIMKALTGDDSQIFKNPKYHPNMTVYTEILKYFVKNGYTGVYGRH